MLDVVDSGKSWHARGLAQGDESPRVGVWLDPLEEGIVDDQLIGRSALGQPSGAEDIGDAGMDGLGLDCPQARNVVMAGTADQVEKLTGEYREWRRLVQEVRGSVERRDPNSIVINGASKRMRPEPDPPAVVTAAASGIDLCAAPSVDSRAEPFTGRTEVG